MNVFIFFIECSIGNVTHTLFAPQVMYVCNGDLVLFQTTTKPYFNDYPLKSFHENKIKKLKQRYGNRSRGVQRVLTISVFVGFKMACVKGVKNVFPI